MDRNLLDIRDQLRRITGTKKGTEYPLMSGKVVSVDEGSGFCTVELTGDDASAPTEGVMLSTVSLNSNGFLLYPVVGSDVIVGQIDGPGSYSLIKCSNLTKASVKIGGAELTIANGKFTIKSGSTSLGDILSHILQHLEALTVSTGVGPSGPPINISDFINDGLDTETLLT